MRSLAPDALVLSRARFLLSHELPGASAAFGPAPFSHDSGLALRALADSTLAGIVTVRFVVSHISLTNSSKFCCPLMPLSEHAQAKDPRTGLPLDRDKKKRPQSLWTGAVTFVCTVATLSRRSWFHAGHALLASAITRDVLLLNLEYWYRNSGDNTAAFLPSPSGTVRN